jgi:hypothetical protein
MSSHKNPELLITLMVLQPIYTLHYTFTKKSDSYKHT